MTILSEGAGSSEGILLLQGGDAYYVPSTADDLKSTLDQLSTALGQVTTALGQITAALTTLDGKPLGTLSPAPAVAGNVAAITSASTAITAAKTEIDELKEILR